MMLRLEATSQVVKNRAVLSQAESNRAVLRQMGSSQAGSSQVGSSQAALAQAVSLRVVVPEGSAEEKVHPRQDQLRRRNCPRWSRVSMAKGTQWEEFVAACWLPQCSPGDPASVELAQSRQMWASMPAQAESAAEAW